jgi:putative oxidoreductase
MKTLAPLLRASMDPDTQNLLAGVGHLVLRAAVGLMIFYIHGWHKLEGGIAFLQHGTPWKLAEEVAGMHFPAPVVSAFAATIVQFVCAPLLAVGLFTRVNALLLTGTLSVAILQNVLADRDPQLAIIYVLILVSMAFLGGGKFSLDARLFSQRRPRTTAFQNRFHPSYDRQFAG